MNLLETIKSMQWGKQDKDLIEGEARIMANLDGLRKKIKICRPSSPNSWYRPPMHVFKKKFDRAAKGNRGAA